MLDIILKENELNFNELEKEFFRAACELACLEFRKLLETIDIYIMNERDKSIYRHKGNKQTTIKTIMGEVTFRRAIYEVKNEENIETKYIYLLDETIGLDTIGLVSMNLAQKIVNNATVVSYRENAKNITELTGQEISHGGAWNVIQKIGEKIIEQEEKTEKKGTKEVKILFEEADGVWLNMQGKDRPKEGKKIELKVAISYEGWKTVSKNRRELVNKQACIGFESAKEFRKKKEKMISTEYNTDEIETRILNGDGASWISSEFDETVQFQLDPFHKYQAVIRNVKRKEHQETLIGLLRENKIEMSFEYIQALINSLEDEKEIEKLNKLYTYFSGNKKGLLPYQKRGIIIPNPPEGIEYCNLGTMEPNIDQMIAHRMKRKKASWSKRGALNLGSLLVLKACKKLKTTIENISKVVLSENKVEEIIEILSSSKVANYDGKGKDGNIHKGKIPFRDTFVTNGRKSIKKMFDYIDFSQMIYR